MSEINLIAKKRDESLRFKKNIRVVRIISIVLLCLVSASSIAIFLIKMNSPLPSLKEEEKSLIASLSLSKSKIAKLAIAEDRVKNVSNLLTKRVHLNQKIENILKETPDGLNIGTLTLNQKTILLSLSSSSLSTVNTFIGNLMVASDKKIFDKIVLGGISVDTARGNYSLSMMISLP